MNLDTDLTPLTKINPKWITDLNVKHKTIKLLKDNVEENLHDLDYGDDFLEQVIKVVPAEEEQTEILLDCHLH